MVQGERYLNYEPGHPSTEALAAAVCFLAVNSMTEDQCQAVFHSTREAAYREYGGACEAALSRAGPHHHQGHAVLQAFVLYLVREDTSSPYPVLA